MASENRKGSHALFKILVVGYPRPFLACLAAGKILETHGKPAWKKLEGTSLDEMLFLIHSSQERKHVNQEQRASML